MHAHEDSSDAGTVVTNSAQASLAILYCKEKVQERAQIGQKNWSRNRDPARIVT